METTVYISRHSEAFRKLIGEYNSNEVEQIRNEKKTLSVVGEEKAKKLSEYYGLREVEVLYSSHYVRAMATAKYVAEKNGIDLNVDERFGERRFGVNDIKELPNSFFEKQIKDWDYKLNDGESLNEVSKRMKRALNELLERYIGNTMLIVSHGTALTTLLKDWCEIKYNETTRLIEIYFKGKLIMDGHWNAPELFKLVFDENKNLIDITKLSI